MREPQQWPSAESATLLEVMAEVQRLKAENQRLRERVDLEQQWRMDTVAQVMRLNQCVECGEMDEQDGVRKNGEFRCVACVKIPETGQHAGCRINERRARETIEQLREALQQVKNQFVPDGREWTLQSTWRNAWRQARNIIDAILEP